MKNKSKLKVTLCGTADLSTLSDGEIKNFYTTLFNRIQELYKNSQNGSQACTCFLQANNPNECQTCACLDTSNASNFQSYLLTERKRNGSFLQG